MAAQTTSQCFFVSQELSLAAGIARNFRDLKIHIYGKPLTTNFESHCEENCKLLEVKTNCSQKPMLKIDLEFVVTVKVNHKLSIRNLVISHRNSNS